MRSNLTAVSARYASMRERTQSGRSSPRSSRKDTIILAVCQFARIASHCKLVMLRKASRSGSRNRRARNSETGIALMRKILGVHQNEYFSANWRIRGFPALEEITPKAGPAAKSFTGRPNFGVFVKLKTSTRKFNECVSVKGNVRWTPRSRLRWSGPRRMPTPQFPNPVP